MRRNPGIHVFPLITFFNTLSLTVSMKASVLCVYNEGSQPFTPLIGGRGFSLLVETDGERTLFGTGLRGRYLKHNMEHLEIDPESVTRVVISHGHADHTGGLSAFLGMRTTAVPVYAPASAWKTGGMFSKNGIKISEESSHKAEKRELEGWTELSRHLSVSPPIDSQSVSESFLVLSGGTRPIVISGCSHCGVETVLETVRKKFGQYPKALVGGLHIDKAPRQFIYDTAEFLKNAECQDLRLNHCTGSNGALRLREVLSLEGVKEFIAGDVIEYDLGLSED